MTRMVLLRILFLFVLFLPQAVVHAKTSSDNVSFVRILDIDPTIVIDLRYATSDNFTGRKVYPLAVGLLRKQTALRLARANAYVKKHGFRIKVWDAYRPLYVQKIFWQIMPDDRYVANPYQGGSRHNRGGAVDVTLVDDKGLEVLMPSAYDDFSSRAWPNNFSLSTPVRKNLRILREAMLKAGFLPLEHEWWHFDDVSWKSFAIEDVRLEDFLLPPAILDQELLKESLQAIVVSPLKGSLIQAQLVLWERNDKGWKASFSSDAVLGRNGVALPGAKREGDGKTPSGVHPLGFAFGEEASLETGLSYRQMTPEDIWVDDTASVDYNRLIQRKDAHGLKSFEEMRREDGLYKAGIVIEYNTAPAVAGLGSAIFVHLWRAFDRPTAGCVALPEDKLRALLKLLNKQAHPKMIIRTADPEQ